MNLYHDIKECRICQYDKLINVLNFGNFASCGIFPPSNAHSPLLPINLVLCENCGLTQLGQNYNLDHLFRDTYGYRSGLNETMISHLKSLVKEIRNRITLTPEDVVLDIGSNDGTTLGFYSDSNCKRIGIDPTSSQFKEYYEPNIIVLPDFFSSEIYFSTGIKKQAKVITSIAMFYDLPDPNAFVKSIAKVLDVNGVWIFEQSYLPTMIKLNSFDTICHEHLEYYCLKPVKLLLEKNGLKIIDVSLNDANGGSFRVTAAHANSPFKENIDSINELLDSEKSEGFLTPEPFQKLNAFVKDLKIQVLNFLETAKLNGKLVHGYGASTKGNTLLQLFGITSDLMPAIADRNPRKFGLTTPGTGISIISENESRNLKPDYYFVLPWHFRNSFLARESDFLRSGGSFVFPMPIFEIINNV